MARRYLSLYFPRWSVDRLERDQPQRVATPCAVARDVRGHLMVAAVNDAAASGGVRTGTRLADARALLPGLDIVLEDAEADERLQRRLVEWCDRYSPLVTRDGADGIMLDVTGCAHLFGGEAALLDSIQKRICVLRFRVRGAMADTQAAAWALARFSQRAVVAGDELAAALAPLPVQALRIPAEIAVELARVGLTTIGALRKVARNSLAARYGPGVVLQLDRALGAAEEPLTPYRAPAPCRAGRVFAEPIGTTAAVEHVLLELLTSICTRLEKEQRGARRFELDCHRVDASVARVEVRTSKANRSITHLMRLFAEKTGSLDAGFGIEIMTLNAAEVDSAAPRQMALPQYGESAESEATLDELLDRMGLRLGFDHVCRLRICESLLPEHATEYVPVTSAAAPNAHWPEYRTRPVRLVEPPSPIEVAEIIPGRLPTRIRVSGRLTRIVRAEGPERLTPEWWRETRASWTLRDYYRVEDERGARLWIFRETRRDRAGEHWFLHGYLA